MAVSSWLVYICIFMITALAVKYFFLRRKLYILSWQLSGPLALPIIGNALMFFCKDEDLFDRTIDTTSKYPSPMRLWFGPKFTVIFTDPEQVENVMTSTIFANKDDDIYRFIKEFDGESLISGSGVKWKKDRKLMTPLFAAKNIKKYFPHVLCHAEELVRSLSQENDQPTFNVEKYLHRSICDLVNKTIMGVDSNSNNGEMDNFLKVCSRMYVIVHARIVKVWLQVEWLYKMTPYWVEQEEAKLVVRDFMTKAYRQAESSHRNKEGEHFVLYQMLDIRDNVPDFANDSEFIDHLSTLFSASEDTITSILSFALVMFGLHPIIQETVAEEVNNCLNGKNVAIEDLNNFKYLDMCIKDILRLFPIAPFIVRVPTEDSRVDKWTIPKGCSVIISIHNIHRDPRNWKKPNKFYPEHFLPEEVKKRHRYAYMPFSAGPRSCLGKQYALLTLKTMLANILQNYIIETDGKMEDYKLKSDISVRFKDDCYPIRIKSR